MTKQLLHQSWIANNHIFCCGAKLILKGPVTGQPLKANGLTVCPSCRITPNETNAMAKIIGIVGSRRRDSSEDYRAVSKVFIDNFLFENNFSIVSGGCPKGGDRFAEALAEVFELKLISPLSPYPPEGRVIKIYYAHWARYGKRAGFERNTSIARDATDLIACVASDRMGGTEDTIRKFEQFHPGKKAIIV